MFKWFERRFLVKIQKYLINIFDQNQNGFVAGMGTSVNIFSCLRNISDHSRNGKVNVAFS